MQFDSLVRGDADAGYGRGGFEGIRVVNLCLWHVITLSVASSWPAISNYQSINRSNSALAARGIHVDDSPSQDRQTISSSYRAERDWHTCTVTVIPLPITFSPPSTSPSRPSLIEQLSFLLVVYHQAVTR